mgnify:CR=1 FL=1
MKKYLLLLVLIFATAASFAQSSESAASASAATTDTEPDKYQLWMLGSLRETYDRYIQDGRMIFQDYRVYNDITPMQDLEEYGNPGMEAYIEELSMNYERFEEYITEVEDYIYSGGTPLTEDKVNEIEESVRMAIEKFVENCCQCAEVYHDSYLPFVEKIEGTQSIVDELLVRVSGYSQLIQDRFYKRVESYTLKLSELTKNAYASMKVNTFMEDYAKKEGFQANLQTYTDELDRLVRMIEVSENAVTILQNAYTEIESECSDVKDEYLPQLKDVEESLYKEIRSYEHYDAECYGLYTDRYINRIISYITAITNILDKAHAAQQGVTGIDAVEADGNADVEFYNLQGVKVNVPEAGMTLIKVDTATGKAQKVVIR